MTAQDNPRPPRRILFVDHTARWSGGEIALHRFITAMDRARYEPLVVLGEEGALAERLLHEGVRVLIEPLADGVRETRKDSLGASGLAQKLLGGGTALLSYSKRIATLAKENQCEMIHCNSLKSDIYGAIAGKLARVPVVWHVRDHIAPQYLPSLMVRTLRTLSKRVPKHVICNSRSTLLSLFGNDEAATARGESTGRYTVVPDCVDETFLGVPEPTVRTEWRTESDARPLYIVIVGRLARWKGQHVFLDAAKIVSNTLAAEKTTAVPDLRFVIAGGALFGEDAYEAEVKAQAKRDLHPGAVEWRGNIADVPRLLAESDLLVHASITPEPFGQVIIEGMAAGLPVIATRGGGVPETIENGRTGLLVPMGEADALAEAMLTFLRDPKAATQIGRNGWHEVRKRFLPRRTATDIETVYDNLLK
ncbi:MAG: glycosyltransferase family 4 protein [Akkermansiaceae bacterium]|nr:glycosyltransferase family 4 protein [Armatimonadota bacterium]